MSKLPSKPVKLDDNAIAALETGKSHPELQDIPASTRDQVAAQQIASENKAKQESQ